MHPLKKTRAIPLTGHTKNVVYAVRCRACHILYVLETGNEINIHIKQHIYKMNSGNGTSILYAHFKVHSPHNLQRTWTTAQRQVVERKWIHRLKTIDPYGLKEKY